MEEKAQFEDNTELVKVRKWFSEAEKVAEAGSAMSPLQEQKNADRTLVKEVFDVHFWFAN